MAEKYGFNPKRRYRTIVIDSLSELNTLSLQRAFGDNPDDLLSKFESDDTRRDYGANKMAMIKVVISLRKLPIHVIATCGSEWDQDERKKLKHQPRLTGALSKEVQAHWNVVGFMEMLQKENDEGDPTLVRRLWLQPLGKFDAKSRLSRQDVGFIDNPSMKKLSSLLTKE
jgi:hypothetical protein